MNSTGSSYFLVFMRERPERRIELYECPRWFVEQANVLPEFLGRADHGGRIRSLYVPYECKDCSSQQDVLVTIDKVRAGRNGVELPAPAPCASCRKFMALAVDRDDYFLFLVESAEAKQARGEQ